MAPPGTSNVTIEVYDAAKKVDRIEGTADVIRIQADGSTLQVVELFAVKNASSPPRTLTADPGFEVAIPEGAQLSGADAQGPNGQPISISPQQLAQKGHYSLPYALKPGETRFQLAYELPYNGEATFSPTLLHSWNHLVLVLPPSIVWKPKNAALFQHMDDQQGGEGNVQVASNVKPGQDLSFRISGTGSFPSPRKQRNRRSATQLPELSRQPSRRRIGTAYRCARRARQVSLVDSWSLGRSACRRSLHLRYPCDLSRSQPPKPSPQAPAPPVQTIATRSRPTATPCWKP